MKIPIVNSKQMFKVTDRLAYREMPDYFQTEKEKEKSTELFTKAHYNTIILHWKCVCVKEVV